MIYAGIYRKFATKASLYSLGRLVASGNASNPNHCYNKPYIKWTDNVSRCFKISIVYPSMHSIISFRSNRPLAFRKDGSLSCYISKSPNDQLIAIEETI